MVNRCLLEDHLILNKRVIFITMFKYNHKLSQGEFAVRHHRTTITQTQMITMYHKINSEVSHDYKWQTFLYLPGHLYVHVWVSAAGNIQSLTFHCGRCRRRGMLVRQPRIQESSACSDTCRVEGGVRERGNTFSATVSEK